MIREMKISLTFQKQAYAVFFVVILSLVRGVAYSNEIGIALETPMALLAFTFCADTYAQEIVSKRSEIWQLCPMKKRMHSIYRRIVIQEMFLLALTVIGYGLFFLFQNPYRNGMGQGSIEGEIYQFFVYFAAIAVTLGFWGLLSTLFSCLFRNMWVGIGGCLLLWLITNSTIGDRIFGAWNLFSYTFRNAENNSDYSWICGKAVCVCIGILAAAALPEIIKKRG
ncbi:MAG: hypothetical protein HFH89_08160 [Lachnospiraceae bacterium]|nr:hypothetical protein [uncultured Acetatifactor sp.]MCI8287609.1 hypothetical protein [Lachnospiraceae bacterium]